MIDHEYELTIGTHTIFFTQESMLEFYNEDDDLIIRIDPSDIKVIISVFDTMMSLWEKEDEYE